MNIKVKIKHDTRHCRICSDMAETCNTVPKCNECKMKSGTWIDTVKSIFETFAIVILDNGEVIKIPTDRIVCDINVTV